MEFFPVCLAAFPLLGTFAIILKSSCLRALRLLPRTLL
jgi:hypothetical protein